MTRCSGLSNRNWMHGSVAEQSYGMHALIITIGVVVGGCIFCGTLGLLNYDPFKLLGFWGNVSLLGGAGFSLVVIVGGKICFHDKRLEEQPSGASKVVHVKAEVADVPKVRTFRLELVPAEQIEAFAAHPANIPLLTKDETKLLKIEKGQIFFYRVSSETYIARWWYSDQDESAEVCRFTHDHFQGEVARAVVGYKQFPGTIQFYKLVE